MSEPMEPMEPMEPVEQNKADRAGQTLAPMSMVTGGRRVAQGIEITSREIVVVRLSCALHGSERGGDEGPDVHDRAHMPYVQYAASDAAAMPALHVDDAVRHPLRPGIVVGADVLDADALASALAQCLTRQAARLAQQGEHAINTLALGLCPSVVVQCEVPLETLMPGFRMRFPGVHDDAAFDALEPWVMLHAQKVSGIDFADLLVDWFRSSPGRDDAVVIAAAQRHYLDVRERLVEAAGATLCALGDAAAAALGACRCVVSRCLHTTPDEDADPALGPLLYPAPIKGARFVGAPQAGAGDAARRAMTVLGQGQGQGPDEAVIAPCYASEQSAAYAPRLSARRVFDAQFNTQRFAAVWLGETAWRAWAFEANGAALERLPVPVARDPHQWMKVLRDYAPKGLALALVSGEIALLEPAGGIRALGASLGCPAIEFDASACCVGPGATPQQLGPSASVAFGLALRELMR